MCASPFNAQDFVPMEFDLMECMWNMLPFSLNVFGKMETHICFNYGEEIFLSPLCFFIVQFQASKSYHSVGIRFGQDFKGSI